MNLRTQESRSMIFRVVIILIIGLSSTSCSNLLIYKAELPGILSMTVPKINIDSLQAAYPGESAVVLHKTSDAHEKYYSGYTSTQSQLRVVRNLRWIILDPMNTRAATVTSTFNDLIGVHDIVVYTYHPDGTRQSYSFDEFTKEPLEGSRQFKLPLKNVTQGTIVDVWWSMTAASDKNFMGWEGVTLADSIGPVLYSSHRHRYLSGMNISYTTFGDSTIRVTNNQDATAYIFEASNLPRLRTEAYEPIEISKNRAIKVVSDVSFKRSFGFGTFWEDNREWLYNFHKTGRKSLQHDKALNDTARNIVAKCRTRLDTLQALKSWIRAKFAFDSRGGEKGNQADYLYYRGGGSSIAMASLYAIMCERLNIPARFVAVYNRIMAPFDSVYRGGNYFNMCASLVEDNGRHYIAMFTDDDVPINLTYKSQLHQPMLICDRDDEWPNFILDVKLENDTLLDQDSIDCTIRPDRSIHVVTQRVTTGYNAMDLRKSLRESKPEDRVNVIRKLLVSNEDENTNVAIRIEGLDSVHLPLRVTAEYDLPSSLASSGSETVLKIASVVPRSELFENVDSTNRLYPIVIYSNQRMSRRITVRYPSEWTAQQSDVTSEISCAAASFTHRQTSVNGALTIQETAKLHVGQHPTSDIGKVAQIAQQVNRPVFRDIVFATQP
ncbi:MAG TPA: transglutaminase domain-containing protein [Chlorobiota bacterium]|nr:transglutaminase domain-containing protein [Chlorobiota bacterium]